MFWIHFKKVDVNISSKISFNARVIHKTIVVIAVAPTSKVSFVCSYVQARLKGQYHGKWPFSLVYVLKPLITAIRAISSSNGFLWWLVTVNRWIPSTIHYIQLFHFCRNTMGYRTEANLGGIKDWLELSFIANTAFTYQSRDLQRFHKQVGFHNSPGHQIMHAKLRKKRSLIFWFLSLYNNWLITQKWMLCWSVVHLKRKGHFKRIEIVISLLVLSYFSIKNQRPRMEKFSVFACMLMMDVNLNTKDSMYIIHISIFGPFCHRKKVCIILG